VVAKEIGLVHRVKPCSGHADISRYRRVHQRCVNVAYRRPGVPVDIRPIAARRLQAAEAVASSSRHSQGDPFLPVVGRRVGRTLGRNDMRRLCLAVLACAIALPSAALAQQQRAPDLRKPAGKEWLTIGGDWGNTRYSTLNQINRDNVKNLKG